jgi:hypothetical protein
MWSYKLINFPFGKEETKWERKTIIPKKSSYKVKNVVYKPLIKDPLWELFDQIKGL